MAKKDEKAEPEKTLETGPDPQSPKDPEKPSLQVVPEPVSPKEIPTAGAIEKVDPKEIESGNTREDGEGIPWTIIGLVAALLILGAGIGYYILKTKGSSGPGAGQGKPAA